MIKQKVFYVLFFTIILTNGFSQNSVNKFDKAGKRHGLWTKNYHKTNQVRYEGMFKHGKEIDSFKYYTLSGGKSVLSAVKVFNEKDSVSDVTFLASNKKVISKGKMNGKRFIGEWIFYHKNSATKMMVENYNNAGLLEGERIIYYNTGVIAEMANYKNGELNGESQWFSEKRTLIKVAYYKDNQLNGKTINYDVKGNIASEGDYVADQKKATWIYYKDGKFFKEINHTTQKVITTKE